MYSDMDVFFLVGAERSGSTLLRLMLDSHPDIACHSEFEFAVDYVSDKNTQPDITVFNELMRKDRIFQLYGYTVDCADSYIGNLERILHDKKGRKALIGATVHRNIGRLTAMFPKARFIHLVRDPRDVANSVRQMGWAGNAYTCAKEWKTVEKDWDALSSGLSPDRHLTISFETLLEAPEQTLTSITGFLGYEFNEGMFDYAKTSTYDKPKLVRKQAWKAKMSQPEIQRVELMVGELLESRGYAFSGHPRMTSLSAIEHKRIRLEDWWYRATFRAKRFGWPLFIKDFLYRKLGLTSFADKTRVQIQAVENASIK